jgi:hypothetical protein
MFRYALLAAASLLNEGGPSLGCWCSCDARRHDARRLRADSTGPAARQDGTGSALQVAHAWPTAADRRRSQSEGSMIQIFRGSALKEGLEMVEPRGIGVKPLKH